MTDTPEYVTKCCCECTLMRPIQTVGIQACDECRGRIPAANPPHHEVAQGEVVWSPRNGTFPKWYEWAPIWSPGDAETMARIRPYDSGWTQDGQQQYTIDKTLSPETQNSVTVPDRSAVIINYLDCDDQVMIEVVDGRGVQFVGPWIDPPQTASCPTRVYRREPKK